MTRGADVIWRPRKASIHIGFDVATDSLDATAERTAADCLNT